MDLEGGEIPFRVDLSWTCSAIHRGGSTGRTAIFVGDSRDIDDIDTRENIELCWGGASRVVKKRLQYYRKWFTYMVAPRLVATDPLRPTCATEGPGASLSILGILGPPNAVVTVEV